MMLPHVRVPGWAKALLAVVVATVLVLGVGTGIRFARSPAGRYLIYSWTNHEGSRSGDVVATPFPIVLRPPPGELDASDTGPDVAATTRLAAAGDVGTASEPEYATAAAMDRVEALEEYDALLLLGDNAYPGGDPALLGETVFDPFHDVLDGPTRLLPVLGNHDNGPGRDAQVSEIGMPARWYSTVVDDALIVSLDSNDPDNPAQLRWLEETLRASDETWRIVEMHHPPFSGGWHGSDLQVRDAFVSLFERYGVQLVLTGHEHDYQRTEQIGGVTYVVSGAAATRRQTDLAEFDEVAVSRYHFVDITIWEHRLEVRAVDHDGNVFDEVVIAA